MIVVHLYHPAGDREIDPVLMGRNKEISDATVAALTAGITYDEAASCDTMAAYHPHWNSQLILLYGSKIVIRQTDATKGRFAVLGDKLIVTWEQTTTEQFRLREDGAHFLTRY
jgi:hypothetical protein